MVVKEDGIIDGHRPELRIRLFGPVDSSMQEHGASHSLDILNSFLGDTILVMGSNTSKPNLLIKPIQVIGELKTGEYGGVIR